MTALTRILARLRGPWVADDPAPDLSWLDCADGLGTRYDAQWPDVRAAEAGEWAGGDLAAMAAPLPITDRDPRFAALGETPDGMARDDLGAYAEPVTVAEWTAPVPYVPEPMPRHVFERIMAAIHEVDVEMTAFADGRAYESGSRCRTESAAMKRASEHLSAPDGARRAALVLAGFTGAEAWAV
jgi:hypothetical protein